MDAVATPSEHRVRCLEPLTKSGGDQELCLEINGAAVGVNLQIERLMTQLLTRLPDRARDLLEIAGAVYGMDAAVSRGGTADQKMGQKWHRRFVVEMPVRDPEFWAGHDIARCLEEMLMFLSGDRFEFAFQQNETSGIEPNRFLPIDIKEVFKATRVLMFSGGLDSFAGALEEIVDQNQRVALISHSSATKIAPVQHYLQKTMGKAFGPECCWHIPVQMQMTGRGLKEGTHRSRSFLFATLGAITAQVFGLSRVSFHENGIVSLNLPPVGNVLGTRATRTTHPQTLTRFTAFFDRVFDQGMRIDNPFFWRTKKDVVETIARLNMGEQIAYTRSCADVHNQTRQYPHCGRCSQCIDRRFAILAAGLEKFDPEEAYRVALMDDPRETVIDREIALSYVRNARAYEHLTPADLERVFPSVLDAVNHLDNPPHTTLSMIVELLRRHGSGVSAVLRNTLSKRSPESFPDGSLPRLYGDAERQAVLPTVTNPSCPSEDSPARQIVVQIDETRGRVTIDGRIEIKRSAAAELIIALAKEWLVGSGQGLDPLDFPFLSAGKLANSFGVESEHAVRRRINRARTLLKERFTSCGIKGKLGEELIENHPWHGYRLKPELVIVRRHKEKG